MNSLYKTALLTGFALLLSLGTVAQSFELWNPGYLGKKNTVVYSAMVFPAFGIYGPFESRKAMRPGLFQENGALSLNHSHQLSLERTLSKSVSVGLAFEFNPTADGSNTGPTYEHFLLNASGLGAIIRLFPFKTKSAMAPLGPYTSIEIKGYRVNILIGDPESPGYKNSISQANQASFGVEFGYQSIVKDVMLVRTGVRYALTGITNVNSSSPSSEFTAERLLAQDAVKVNLGIGYLF